MLIMDGVGLYVAAGAMSGGNVKAGRCAVYLNRWLYRGGVSRVSDCF